MVHGKEIDIKEDLRLSRCGSVAAKSKWGIKNFACFTKFSGIRTNTCSQADMMMIIPIIGGGYFW